MKHDIPERPCLILDSSSARARHASSYFEDTDPDSGNIISPSVAMAIAGSPLPHAKANPFALPSVVSDDVKGQTALLGPTDGRVTDRHLRGKQLLHFLFLSTVKLIPRFPVEFLFFLPDWAPVQPSFCWVQPDSARLLPVGAEERRCISSGALGVRFVCAANQPFAGSTSSLCVLFWIQGKVNRNDHLQPFGSTSLLIV